MKARFAIENETPGKLDFQIEPECWPFSLEPGESAVVVYECDDSCPTLQLTVDDRGGVVFGAIFPSDKGIAVEKDGENVVDKFL